MLNVLVVGPSPQKSKGGMATVISDIRDDKDLNSCFNIETYDSYIDGNVFMRRAYSILAFAKFYLTKRDYDVYHIHAASRGSTFRKGYYVRAAKKWRKKVVFHIHGAQYIEFYDEISQKKRNTVVNILNMSDVVVALSNDWKRKFETLFGITNCVALENGINTGMYKDACNDVSQHTKEFLMLGRMGHRKGTYDLLEAIDIARKEEPEIKCYLAGDGETDKVRRLVYEKGLENNCIICGWVDYNKKVELLKKVSTVVLPSYNEGLPMAILEGMAAGKAIISTNVGAIPEVVTSENGIIFSPGDTASLSDALIKCCRDSEMVCRMSEQNKKKIKESYSTKSMHDKMKDIYFSAWGGVKVLVKFLITLYAEIYYSLCWMLSTNRIKNNCTNTDARSEEIIVSLTSFPERIGTVHKTIKTILNQKELKPDGIEIWLASEQFPNQENDLPKSLMSLKKFGLKICWCDDLRSYKKLIPALKQHPDSVIVTVDDDVYYDRKLVERLYEEEQKTENVIVCNKATQFRVLNDKFVAFGGGHYYYKNASYLNKLVGVGGVLYPPHTLSDEVFNSEIFEKYAPTNDDIWFWFMAVLKGSKILVAKKNKPKPIEVFEFKKSPKLTEINDKAENYFWRQFDNLIRVYPDVNILLREEFQRYCEF